ncbi:MAG: type II secretion system F family protein [Lachnospiraceae bacterium]|nr:type II secretion system F family protein [Lachnospiraceae bacterium]
MLIKLVCLIIGTICVVLVIIGSANGNRYSEYIRPLPEKDFPYKEFYSIGWFLSEIPIFRLRGKVAENLKKSAKLVWANDYSDFYAATAWAQFLTAATVTVCFGCVLTALFPAGMEIIPVGFIVLAIAAEWNLIISKMKEQVEKRTVSSEIEFPNMVFKLSLLINSGMILRDAWFQVANGKEGALYDLMRIGCEDMTNGYSDAEAIEKFGVLSDSNEIKKFASSLIQGMEKGNSDLGSFLLSQTSELLAHKRQVALQAGEKAAGKLIIPVGITFAGILLIIMAATMQGMTF